MKVSGFHGSQGLRTGAEIYKDMFFFGSANFDDSERFSMWSKMMFVCRACAVLLRAEHCRADRTLPTLSTKTWCSSKRGFWDLVLM